MTFVKQQVLNITISICELDTSVHNKNKNNKKVHLLASRHLNSIIFRSLHLTEEILYVLIVFQKQCDMKSCANTIDSCLTTNTLTVEF